MYTLCRSQEVCFVEWKEIDFEKEIWTIPAEKMKMDKEHIVPLSEQAIAILKELKPFTGDKDFVFASFQSKLGHIRGESLSKALRENLGYKDKHTIHGFRSMGSTLLNEKGYRHDIIEKSLAHAGEDRIRAIYNRAVRL